ncbi:cell division protein pelota [Archaeoglobus sulfaticallidus PM70-1]|uniref:Protein pelota homolog n=1 Tax=Archaeoglobus sulfaticallidus PM70-1 TaxID=387631 RepID=N0BF05_9EURY|nr:mRNA surveillance protein pelota [Archaeoglobus sulfaticallidus]AGK61598.1 cell division protein pelota [Archaeoglobus sulfaticallidus PM70-1]
MKVVEENIKGEKGEIKLIPENLDDLWHLKFIIEPGDIVFALTKRVSESSDKLRSDKEKITVRIGIEVEKVEFQKFSNRLRVSGKIVAGVEDSGHHTINISVNKEISIIKERWKKEQIERIKKAIEASQRPEVIVITIEEGSAVIGVLREWGIEEIATINRSYGKGEGNYRSEFFAEILNLIRNIEFRYGVVAGPGFTKDDFLKFLKDREPEIAKVMVKADASSIGVRGFIEVLRRGVIDRIVGELRLSLEAEYMERLLAEISRDGKAVYGKDEVEKAMNYGAVEVLLIVDDYMLKERENWDVDGLMRAVEDSGGKVVILSSEFEPGKQLVSLGGIAALLRFQIQ